MTKQSAELSAQALELYRKPLTVKEVGAELGVSYGTAYALIKQSGGPTAFRRSGTRIKRDTIEYDSKAEVQE